MWKLFEKKIFERIVKKKKKESGGQKISSKGQLTGILTELPGNRNFFPVTRINSGQTGIMEGLSVTTVKPDHNGQIRSQGKSNIRSRWPLRLIETSEILFPPNGN